MVNTKWPCQWGMSHIWVNLKKGDDSKSGLSPEEAIKTVERLDELLDELYEYEVAEDESWIKCLKCGKTSYHSMDIAHKYCGVCHKFHIQKRGI